ncbi:hypothetical protein LP415_19205 [Polaromonas sp. P1(28)-8]|nr:hypothetical protein LP415_19205 [Polaromonas sp. P1(28)-8]
MDIYAYLDDSLVLAKSSLTNSQFLANIRMKKSLKSSFAVALLAAASFSAAAQELYVSSSTEHRASADAVAGTPQTTTMTAGSYQIWLPGEGWTLLSATPSKGWLNKAAASDGELLVSRTNFARIDKGAVRDVQSVRVSHSENKKHTTWSNPTPCGDANARAIYGVVLSAEQPLFNRGTNCAFVSVNKYQSGATPDITQPANATTLPTQAIRVGVIRDGLYSKKLDVTFDIFPDSEGFTGDWGKAEIAADPAKSQFIAHLQSWVKTLQAAVDQAYEGKPDAYKGMVSWRVGSMLPRQ